MSQTTVTNGPPTTSDVVAALENAGYPFELRVYRQFEAEGLAPVLSFRYRTDDEDPKTKEIDVVARVNRFQDFTDAGRPSAAKLGLLLFVEVKRMHRGCFVGLRGLEPELRERRFERAAAAAGLPSFHVMPEFSSADQLVIGSGEKEGIANAFDLLNQRPYCVHWATVKPSKSGKNFEAGHDDGFADDLQRLVRSSLLLARDNARHLLDHAAQHGENQGIVPEMIFYSLLLVVDAPIYVYDPTTRQIAPDDWITLHLGVDVGGRVSQRPIDVVSSTGLATIITAYKETGDRMKWWLDANVLDFAGAAHGQVIIHRNRQKRLAELVR